MQPVDTALTYCEENVENGYAIKATPDGNLTFAIEDEREALRFQNVFPALTTPQYRFLFWE